MSRFHIENFGCRAARADGEAISSQLRAAGSRQAPGGAEADVVIVNTCSVTAEADRAARAFIRRTHRQNPAAKIIVTGCYAQRAPRELAAMDGVAAVVGNSHKALASRIALGLSPNPSPNLNRDLVPVRSLLSGRTEVFGQTSVLVDDRFAHSMLEEAQLAPGEQTRPNLKIQEGCGNRCTFCVIPTTRGPSKSLSPEAVLRQVEGFVAAGGSELVLSGINLGRWGRDLPGRPRFPRLVREILQGTRLPRLRLSSIEPMDWDEELLGVLGEFGGKRLARHAHLPLQSGSDAVLRRMHRRYRPWHYLEKVTALFRAAGPQLTLGADVMVGFPGETDAEFEETLELVRTLPFGYLHLFPFSPRPGTPGWEYHVANPVPAAAIEARMTRLRALAAEKTRTHRAQFVDRELDAITLHTPASTAAKGRTAALSENFLPVEIDGHHDPNRLIQVRVTGVDRQGELSGSIAGQ